MCTVTNNATNFVKVFNCFGVDVADTEESETVVNFDETESEEDDNGPETAFAAASESSDKDDQMEPLRSGSSLSPPSQKVHGSHLESSGQRYRKSN